MREIPIAKARDELTTLPEQLADEPATIAVMRRGKPVLAIMPWELYESIIETLEIMGDEELMASLRQAIQEVAEGKTVPWERVEKELNLEVPDRTRPKSTKNARKHLRSPRARKNSRAHKGSSTRARKTG